VLTKLGFLLISICMFACGVPQGSGIRHSSPPNQADGAKLRRVADVPAGEKSYNLQCISERSCWASSFLKQWRTDDGGGHWRLVFTANKVGQEIVSYMYINPHHGWILTNQRFYKTEDGGVSWLDETDSILDNERGELTSFTFTKDGLQGWVGGGLYRKATNAEVLGGVPNTAKRNDGRILQSIIIHTEDGGTSWSTQDLPKRVGRIYQIRFITADIGVALGDGGTFYTHNGGKLWKDVNFDSSCTLQKYREAYDARALEVFFLDTKLAWLVFDDGRIAKTFDSGRNWCDLLAPNAVDFDYYEKYFKKVYFVSPEHGWGLGANLFLYESKDGGATWKKTSNDEFDDLYFLDDHTGWLVSGRGIFRLES
jgi:photosystem II stability/assembly factor-like uncharacterized protein